MHICLSYALLRFCSPKLPRVLVSALSRSGRLQRDVRNIECGRYDRTNPVGRLAIRMVSDPQLWSIFLILREIGIHEVLCFLQCTGFSLCKNFRSMPFRITNIPRCKVNLVPSNFQRLDQILGNQPISRGNRVIWGLDRCKKSNSSGR